MSKKNRRWTVEEKDLFMSYAFADDSPSIRENIEFARYKLYEEGAHPEQYNHFNHPPSASV